MGTSEKGPREGHGTEEQLSTEARSGGKQGVIDGPLGSVQQFDLEK